MEQAILRTIQEHNMLTHGDNVIVALSGGADSVALFHFLLQRRGTLGITLAAAHFEHGMRAETSLRDAAFVAGLCQTAGVPLYTGHGEMQTTPRPAAMSHEEWARRLRYAFLEELAEKYSSKIATAHNLGDNAETVLFHAIRGAGPRGLSGIPSVRGPFIRPLLGVQRADIEAYCKANGLAYVTDETNADPKYARNRLRLEVLPALEAIHPGAARALARSAADMRVLDAFLEELAAGLLAGAKAAPPNIANLAALEKPGGQENEHAYNAQALRAAPAPVLLKAFALLAGPSASRDCLARMQAVLAGESRAAQMPKGRRSVLRKGLFCVERVPAGHSAQPVEIPLKEGEFVMPGGYRLRVETCEIMEFRQRFTNSSKKSNGKVLNFAADYDKIAKNSVFRARRPGDSFYFGNRGVTKPLKKWMNEQGLPPTARAQLPLLWGGGAVLWLYGQGFDTRLTPSGATKRVLLIREE